MEAAAVSLLARAASEVATSTSCTTFESIERARSANVQYLLDTSRLAEAGLQRGGQGSRQWLTTFLAEGLRREDLPAFTLQQQPGARSRSNSNSGDGQGPMRDDAWPQQTHMRDPAWHAQHSEQRLSQFKHVTNQFGEELDAAVDSSGFYLAAHMHNRLSEQGSAAQGDDASCSDRRRMQRTARRSEGLRYSCDGSDEGWEDDEDEADVSAGRVFIMQALVQMRAAVLIQRAFRAFKRRCEQCGWPSQRPARRAAARRRAPLHDWQNDTVFRTLLLGRKFIEAEQRKQREWEQLHGIVHAGSSPLDKARDAARLLIEAGRHMRDHGVPLPAHDATAEAMLEHLLFSGGLELLGELCRAKTAEEIQRIISERTAALRPDVAAAIPVAEQHKPAGNAFLSRVTSMLKDAKRGVKKGGFGSTSARFKNPKDPAGFAASSSKSGSARQAAARSPHASPPRRAPGPTHAVQPPHHYGTRLSTGSSVIGVLRAAAVKQEARPASGRGRTSQTSPSRGAHGMPRGQHGEQPRPPLHPPVHPDGVLGAAPSGDEGSTQPSDCIPGSSDCPPSAAALSAASSAEQVLLEGSCNLPAAGCGHVVPALPSCKTSTAPRHVLAYRSRSLSSIKLPPVEPELDSLQPNAAGEQQCYQGSWEEGLAAAGAATPGAMVGVDGSRGSFTVRTPAPPALKGHLCRSGVNRSVRFSEALEQASPDEPQLRKSESGLLPRQGSACDFSDRAASAALFEPSPFVSAEAATDHCQPPTECMLPAIRTGRAASSKGSSPATSTPHSPLARPPLPRSAQGTPSPVQRSLPMPPTWPAGSTGSCSPRPRQGRTSGSGCDTACSSSQPLLSMSRSCSASGTPTHSSVAADAEASSSLFRSTSGADVLGDHGPDASLPMLPLSACSQSAASKASSAHRLRNSSKGLQPMSERKQRKPRVSDTAEQQWPSRLERTKSEPGDFWTQEISTDGGLHSSSSQAQQILSSSPSLQFETYLPLHPGPAPSEPQQGGCGRRWLSETGTFQDQSAQGPGAGTPSRLLVQKPLLPFAWSPGSILSGRAQDAKPAASAPYSRHRTMSDTGYIRTEGSEARAAAIPARKQLLFSMDKALSKANSPQKLLVGVAPALSEVGAAPSGAAGAGLGVSQFTGSTSTSAASAPRAVPSDAHHLPRLASIGLDCDKGSDALAQLKSQSHGLLHALSASPAALKSLGPRPGKLGR